MHTLHMGVVWVGVKCAFCMGVLGIFFEGAGFSLTFWKRGNILDGTKNEGPVAFQ